MKSPRRTIISSHQLAAALEPAKTSMRPPGPDPLDFAAEPFVTNAAVTGWVTGTDNRTRNPASEGDQAGSPNTDN